MLSYQHAYHAGNFADIHKHWLLVLLIEALSRKDKPWCYLDTHSGRGKYPLDSDIANKTAEWREGVGQIWKHAGKAPESLQSFIQLLGVSDGIGGQEYPGSPEVVKKLMRPNDRAVLCELHPQEFEWLKKHYRHCSNIHLHFRDGFEGVLGMVPPPEKRGLVLIDPSYELKQDYQRIPAYLEKLRKRWAGACVAIWYPVLAEARHNVLLEGVRKSSVHNVLRSEIRKKNVAKGMVGSGMLIMNPPWKVDQTIEAGWSFLVESLQLDDRLSVAVDWLKPEQNA
ncbi:23S rRNA (adenine(2030)-N(6))-methyltransferase RlmJ [Hahella ganghwensis]|uniref:23S rRNA (adenine(2030)-N(6))-methyltransferase RlmJ n=1 Tax=Hahella ganghwensis TaxID=286420 RepID=UPI0003790FF5|nr:23S rRNA (adenine(2030)-N(6))-methyltransferase RlmJ [Hahella ganghwensis]